MSQKQNDDAQLKKRVRRRKQKPLWHGTVSNVKEPDKKVRWMCPWTISTRWDEAEEPVILVCSQKQVPPGTVEDNTIDLSDERDD